MHLIPSSFLVTTSKALVSSSFLLLLKALVPSSFLLLLVRHLFLLVLATTSKALVTSSFLPPPARYVRATWS